MRALAGVIGKPAVGLELCLGTEAVQAARAGAGGVLPFGLGRQPVTVGGKVTRPARLGLVVARRESLHQRALVAVELGLAPAHTLDRLAAVILPAGGVWQLRLDEQVVCDLELIHEEHAQSHLVTRALVGLVIVGAHLK